MYRQITGRYIDQVSVKYRPIIGQVSAKCLRGIGDLKAISADIHIDRLSTDYRPTIHRVSTECRSTVHRVSIDSRSSVDRVSTATSTDIAVDIAVDSTYSKHDPKDEENESPNFVSLTIIIIIDIQRYDCEFKLQYRSKVSFHRRALQESRSVRRRRNCKFTKLGSCAILIGLFVITFKK